MLIIKGILKDQPCEYRLIDAKLQGLRYRPIFNEYLKANCLSILQGYNPKGMLNIFSLLT